MPSDDALEGRVIAAGLRQDLRDALLHLIRLAEGETANAHLKCRIADLWIDRDVGRAASVVESHDAVGRERLAVDVDRPVGVIAEEPNAPVLEVVSELVRCRSHALSPTDARARTISRIARSFSRSDRSRNFGPPGFQYVPRPLGRGLPFSVCSRSSWTKTAYAAVKPTSTACGSFCALRV